MSCHADGNIRFWDLNTGKPFSEINLQLTPEEGLTCMDLNNDHSLIAVSGSKGHMRVSFIFLILFFDSIF